jgi:hypothetical protein
LNQFAPLSALVLSVIVPLPIVAVLGTDTVQNDWPLILGTTNVPLLPLRLNVSGPMFGGKMV